MPNCFQMTRKSEPEKGPVPLSKIDDELCAYLGVKSHPTMYHAWWYDIIGFALACGKTFAELRERYGNPVNGDEGGDYDKMLTIVNWLDEHFTSDAWAEVGRRVS